MMLDLGTECVRVPDGVRIDEAHEPSEDLLAVATASWLLGGLSGRVFASQRSMEPVAVSRRVA
jgi:hypothetical protein